MCRFFHNMILMARSTYCKKSDISKDSVEAPLDISWTRDWKGLFWVCFIPWFSVPWAELLSCVVQRGSSTEENPCTKRQIRHNRSIQQKDTESVLAHVSTVRMNTASCSLDRPTYYSWYVPIDLVVLVVHRSSAAWHISVWLGHDDHDDHGALRWFPRVKNLIR